MFSRRVTCKNCGFKGVVETHNTKHLPKESFLDHWARIIHLQCPSCNTDNPFGPTEFVNPLIKIGCLLLAIAGI